MNGQTEIKYNVTRAGHLYLALNKWTLKEYQRLVSAPRRWTQDGQPVDNEQCIDALEDSVTDYVSRKDSQRRHALLRDNRTSRRILRDQRQRHKAAREPRGNGRVE